MAIPKDEWLDQAKRLPVGQIKRVRHNQERDSAMVVKNLPDRWTCYCHRCHQGGVIKKEFVHLSDAMPEPYLQKLPQDAMDMAQEIGCELYTRRLGRLMPPPPPTPWLYSKSADRLILRLQQGYVGRSLNKDHPSKWVAYASMDGHYPKYGSFPGDVVALGGRVPIVVTEDALSMNKVRFSMGSSVLAITSLGTTVQNELLTLFLMLQVPIIFFYDDDQAGYDGADIAVARLRGLGLNVHAVFPSLGLDPKDLTVKEIQEILTW